LGNGIAQRRSEVAGIDLYLVKPIDVAKLQIVLEKFRHVISV
jgi:response regulator of citrate/malate metabolism